MTFEINLLLHSSLFYARRETANFCLCVGNVDMISSCFYLYLPQ